MFTYQHLTRMLRICGICSFVRNIIGVLYILGSLFRFVNKERYGYEEQNITVMLDRQDVMEHNPQLAPMRDNIVSEVEPSCALISLWT